MRIAYIIKNKENNILITLDTIRDSSISIQSRISTHPIASGEIIADHKYDEPISMRISGVFALNSLGSIFNIQTSFEKTQKMFEDIKTKGIPLQITKISIEESSQAVRFTTRKNMILQNIEWIEKVNTLEYTFSFLEVMTIDVSNPQVDTKDNAIPDLEGVVNANFTETLLNWDELDTIVIEACKTTGFMSDTYAQYRTKLKDAAIDYGKGLLGPAGPGFSAGLIEKSVEGGDTNLSLGDILTSFGESFIGGGLALVELIQAISGIVKEENYTKEVFKMYESEKERKQTDENFETFNDDIHKAIEQLNDAVIVYKISTNKEQTCLVNLLGVYYRFVFEKNNINRKYRVSVFDMENKLVRDLPDIATCPKSIYNCTNGTELFYIENSGYPVYILYNIKPENINDTKLKINEVQKSNLTNYLIVASKIDLSTINSLITDIVKRAISRAAS